MMSFVVSCCQGLSLNLISTVFQARKLNLMEVHTPSLFELSMLNAQSTQLCFAQFGTICTVLKTLKTPVEDVTFSKPKITLLHKCFSRFLNCINGTKSRKLSHQNLLPILENWKIVGSKSFGRQLNPIYMRAIKLFFFLKKKKKLYSK